MITVNNITKTFKFYASPVDRLKEIFFKRSYHKTYTAINNVSFDAQNGEILGIVGRNGAGKSTVLKLLSGILLPDGGTMTIDGQIIGLLELGTGFNPELSGIQNIYLNGTLLGLPPLHIARQMESIVDFTELNEFINKPVKTYSTGMIMRLAISIAFHAEYQALFIDEAIAVGDANFQQKCIKRLLEMKKNGASIIIVSHDMNAIKILSDKALLLEKGHVIDYGCPEAVINSYNYILAQDKKGTSIPIIDQKNRPNQYGNFKVEIQDASIINKDGLITELLISGEACQLNIHLMPRENFADVTVGISIRDRFGQEIFATSSYHLKYPIQLKANEKKTIVFEFDQFNIGPGKYSLTVASHSGSDHIEDCYHWVDFIKNFKVIHNSEFYFIGVARLLPTVKEN